MYLILILLAVLLVSACGGRLAEQHKAGVEPASALNADSTPVGSPTAFPTLTMLPTPTLDADSSAMARAGDLAPQTEAALAALEPEVSEAHIAGPRRLIISQSKLSVFLEKVAQGFEQPVGLLPDPGGQLYLVDRKGVIYRLDDDKESSGQPFLVLHGQGGVDMGSGTDAAYGLALESLAFHPEFTQIGRFYVYYTFLRSNDALQDWGLRGRLSEFSLLAGASLADPASERVLLELERPYLAEEVPQIAFASGVLTFELSARSRPDARLLYCFNLEQPWPLQQACSPNTVKMESASEQASDILHQAGLIGAGRFYTGEAFPALSGKVMVAGRRESGKSDSFQLFIANQAAGHAAGVKAAGPSTSSLETMASQSWKLKELQYTLDGGGRLVGDAVAVGQDAAGELYILVAQAGKTGSGRVYKIAPLVPVVHSVIAEPAAYLPLEYSYARVPRSVPVYLSLDDVSSGTPFAEHGGGNYWVSLRGSAKVNGQVYYRAAWGWGVTAWIAARHVLVGAPLSHLSGVILDQHAGELLAMAYQAVHVRSSPGVLKEETIIGTLLPYDLVTVLEQREVNGSVWYRIGQDQWSHSQYLRVFLPGTRPDKIGPDDKWVEVNLDQQILIAHQGDRPVYATLVSTGRRGLETKKGLFRVWSLLREGPMRWEDARPPYNLANVPWIMYFNQGQGLHGAYWHDQFGMVRSAGCVNLSPRDASWLFHWAGPVVEPEQRILYTSEENPGVWVWVHDTRQDLEAAIAARMMENIQAPGPAGSIH